MARMSDNDDGSNSSSSSSSDSSPSSSPPQSPKEKNNGIKNGESSSGSSSEDESVTQSSEEESFDKNSKNNNEDDDNSSASSSHKNESEESENNSDSGMEEKDIKKLWEKDPDFYGIRRSSRSKVPSAPPKLLPQTQLKSQNKRGSKKGGRGKERKKIKVIKDSDESSSSDDESSRSRRKRDEKVSYKEAESEDEEESVVGDEGEEAIEEEIEDHVDTIEKIMGTRTGKVGATGSGTTIYAVAENGDPNEGDGSESTELESQFLIKWATLSHLHNTWESLTTLKEKNVKGLKKLDNFCKREDDLNRWKKSANVEDIEYYECQLELQQELAKCYTQAERIIAEHRSDEGESEYYVKWDCLSYAEATWESGSLIQSRNPTVIEIFKRREASNRTPTTSQKQLRSRPKFNQLKSQPNYMRGDSGTLELRDYQLDGLNWLIHSWCKENSVILADEMGLGKTIQSICFLSYLFQSQELYGPFLLVVPLSTMTAWQKEFTQWAPDINVVTYLGDVLSRDIIREYEWYFKSSPSKLKFNAILTTYEIVLKDKGFLGEIPWAILMVDEAHRLKNGDSLLYKSLQEFNSIHRILITGTPLQNSLKELWSLLHFIMPHNFSEWDSFEKEHENAATKGYSKLHRQLEPYILRRVKKDVEKSLPSKVEQILRVDMTSLQKQYYKWILTKNYSALRRGVKGSVSSFINIVMELKKCCNHALLVKPREGGGAESMMELVRGSGKLMLLDKLLVRLKETGHRVLIFSQMVRMLDIIAEYLQQRRFAFQRLDGSIKGDLRKQALDHFNAEGSTDFCFLLSTRAGGLGINLATADTVIIFDSDWNPQNDLQAQARAHRIGQKNQVNIYRLVTKDSVEEDIVERAKRKMVLDHLVIQRMDTTGRTVLEKGGGKGGANPFNKEELTAILKFGAEELFKEEEADGEDVCDIDEILKRAETNEEPGERPDSNNNGDFKMDLQIDEIQNETDPDLKMSPIYEPSDENEFVSSTLTWLYSAPFVFPKVKNVILPPLPPPQGDELLSAFKVASFAVNEEETEVATTKDWESIIPEEMRSQIERLEKEKEMAELYLPPRSSRAGVGGGGESSGNIGNNNEALSKIKRKRRREEESEEEDESEGEGGGRKRRRKGGGTKRGRPKAGGVTLSDNLIRKFIRSFKRYPDPMGRLDVLARDSGLDLTTVPQLRKVGEQLLKGLKDSQSFLNEGKSSGGPVHIKESVPDPSAVGGVGGDGKKVREKGPSFKVGGINVNARTLSIALSELAPLGQVIPKEEEARKAWKFELKAKAASYDVNWGSDEDTRLLLGIYEHGIGAWDTVAESDPLLKEKLFNESEKDKKPQLKHLQSRADYLLRVIKKHVESTLVNNPKTKSRSRKEKAESKLLKSIIEDGVKGESDESQSKKEKKAKKSKTKNGAKNSNSKLSSSSLDMSVLDPGQDPKIFNECKEKMRPVKNALKSLDNPDKKLSAAELHAINTTHLIEIGNQIKKCLSSYTDSEEYKNWKANLWQFVSKFTEHDAIKLYKWYKKSAKLSKADSKDRSTPSKTAQNSKNNKTPPFSGVDEGERKKSKFNTPPHSASKLTNYERERKRERFALSVGEHPQANSMSSSIGHSRLHPPPPDSIPPPPHPHSPDRSFRPSALHPKNPPHSPPPSAPHPPDYSSGGGGYGRRRDGGGLPSGDPRKHHHGPPHAHGASPHYNNYGGRERWGAHGPPPSQSHPRARTNRWSEDPFESSGGSNGYSNPPPPNPTRSRLNNSGRSNNSSYSSSSSSYGRNPPPHSPPHPPYDSRGGPHSHSRPHSRLRPSYAKGGGGGEEEWDGETGINARRIDEGESF